MTRVEVVVLLAGLALLFAMLVPSFFGSRAKQKLAVCEKNERTLGAALETYAADNGRAYPPQLPDLMPRYLKEIPRCAASGKSPLYSRATPPNAYTVYCAGAFHTRAWALFESVPLGPSSGVGENFPQYSPQKGFVLH